MDNQQLIFQLSDLIGLALKIYSWINIAAILMTWLGPDPYNPVVYHLNKLTQPFWKWVELRSPQSLRPLSTYIAILLIYFAMIAVPGVFKAVAGLFFGLLSFKEALGTTIGYISFGAARILSQYLGFISLIAFVWFIMGIIGSPLNHPLIRSVFLIIDPILTPVQKYLPRTSIDLSPIVVAIAAYLASDWILIPLKHVAPLIAI